MPKPKPQSQKPFRPKNPISEPKQEQPNCEICEWRKREEHFWFSDVWTSIDFIYYCSAQGNSICFLVYNNEACNKLYEKRIF